MIMNSPSFYWLLAFLVVSNYAFSQYSISGHLDTPKKGKKIYLSLLKYNEQMTVYENQVITYTRSDSLGFFRFEGNLLSEKHAFYRIHAEIDDGFGPNQMKDNEELKNLHNFVFSNNDTIVFEKNKKYWFSDNINTNPIDKEWRDFNDFSKQMRLELFSISDLNQRQKYALQFLSELKSYANSKDIHPLVALILTSSVKESILKQDIEEDPEFYNNLQKNLNNYYGDVLYAAQFEELLTDLSKNETQIELKNVKKFVLFLSLICVLLLAVIVYLILKLKRTKVNALQHSKVNLTNQEERVAELIVQEKSNKEIADELFISLSTVKTHIRNLYAKLEVSNRQEFVEKIKNQPRD